jgi:hypothetical protein
MITYIIFLTVIGFIALLDIFLFNRELPKLIYLIESILFFLFIGLRENGYDYESYSNIFDGIKDGILLPIEPAFQLICSFSNSYRELLLVMALLTIILHLSFIYKMSTLPFFSLFLIAGTYLLPTFMGQMRQGVAIGFIAWSFYFINDKKKFFVLLIIASLFHTSALLAILFLIIPKTVKTSKYYLFTIILAIIGGVLLKPIILQLTGFFPEDIMMVDKVNFYSETENYALGLNFAIIIKIVVLVLAFTQRNNITVKNFPLMLNIYHFSILLYVLLGSIPQLGGRGSQYFSYFDVVLIPIIINASVGIRKAAILTIFYFLTILRIMQFFMDDFNYFSYVPYFTV